MDDMKRAFFEETGLLNMEEAMKDPVVQRVIEDAKSRALAINIEHNWDVPDDYPIEDDNTIEFDARTLHLMSTAARVSGTVNPVHPDVKRLSVDEACVNFMGYVADSEDGQLEYKYYFQLFVDSDIEEGLVPLTMDEVVQRRSDKSSGGVGVILASASFDYLHLDFEVMHPQRSMAWLSENAPGVIEEIDRRIIGESGDFSEQAILNLRGMDLVLPENMDAKDVERFRYSVAEYINAMISIDHDVPYVVRLFDSLEVNDASSKESLGWVSKTKTYLMSIDTVAAGQRVNADGDTEDQLILYVSGRISDLEDPDIPAVQAALSLDNIESLDSMRKTQKMLIAALGKAGLAK